MKTQLNKTIAWIALAAMFVVPKVFGTVATDSSVSPPQSSSREVSVQTLNALDANSASVWTADLTAGQSKIIGTVTAAWSGKLLMVNYNVTEPGWCMTDTHLYVGGNSPAKIAPGRFPESHGALGCTQNDTYTISCDNCNQTYIAAHASVQHWAVPIGTGNTYRVTYPSNISYFDGYLNGTYYPAYCVDVGRYITPGTQYPNCTIYSSLDAHLPAGTVDKPENLDLVNYVNTHFNPATKVYTFFDGTILTTSWQAVQGAIWHLIDNSGNCAAGNLSGLSWNASQCTQIANDALAHGNGFVPKNGDRIKFLVSCSDTQTTAIVPQVTGLDEVVDSGSLLGSDTAWALRSDGSRFNNSIGQVTGWGKYFQINPASFGCY